MIHNLYVTATEVQSGKSLVVLGLMDLLLQEIPRVGFFRPIISNGNDRNIEMIRSYFQLSFDYDEMYGCKAEMAEDLLAKGEQNTLMSKILEKYKELEEKCDFVLCEGTDFRGITSSFEFDINAEIASTLNCPVVLVINGKSKTSENIQDSIGFAKEIFAANESPVLATIINRVENGYQGEGVYTIPESKELNYSTVGNVKNILNATCVYGEDYINRRVEKYVIGKSNNFLSQLQNRSLVITSADRLDIIFASALSFLSKEGANVSGIVLTDGASPSREVMELLENLDTFRAPILTVEQDAFSVVAQIQNMHSDTMPYDKRKILTSLQIFEERFDRKRLQEVVKFSQPPSITPKIFEYNLIKKARSKKMRIVLPEGTEERILKAAEIVTKRNFAELILLGKPEQIHGKINRLDLNLKNIQVIDPHDSPLLETFADQYYELRKHKGISEHISRETVTDVNFFGTLMVNSGHADGMVSGSVHTTAQTIRPALQIIGTSGNNSIVSSVFFMCLKNNVLVYGDCAINPNPNSEQLAEIAVASGRTARIFGIDPRVAMLSYSTGSSGKGTDVEKVAQATEIAKSRDNELLIEGPIQYDAAVDLDVAKTKLPSSQVAGRATVLIFPDLNTGNNTYKAVQRSTGALAIGPVLQGLKKPINDLSRGCTINDIVNTIAITAIQAQGIE